MRFERPHWLLVILVLAIIFGIAIFALPNHRGAMVAKVSPAPTHAPQAAKATPVASSSATLYPKKDLTPGDVFPNATKEQVCTAGYSATVRNVTVQEKKAVYQEYGITYPQKPGAYEVDHFIPLELGGSNTLVNLWPEPATPSPGFHQKDQVENYLQDQVCSGKMPLVEAQDKIKTDWVAVYQTMHTTTAH